MSIDFTKPLQSDGIPMRLLCTDAPGDYPVVCLNPYGIPFTFTLDGRTAKSQENHPRNLRNAAEEVTVDVWVNIYPPIESKTLALGFIYSTKEKALKGKDNTSIATLHIKRTVPVGHVDE